MITVPWLHGRYREIRDGCDVVQRLRTKRSVCSRLLDRSVWQSIAKLGEFCDLVVVDGADLERFAEIFDLLLEDQRYSVSSVAVRVHFITELCSFQLEYRYGGTGLFKYRALWRAHTNGVCTHHGIWRRHASGRSHERMMNILWFLWLHVCCVKFRG